MFDGWTDKKVVNDNSISVEHRQPLLFGTDKNKGLAKSDDGFGIQVVTIGENGVSEADILVHDQTNKILAMMLADMKQPEFPVALGELYNNPAKAFAEAVHEQLDEVGTGSFNCYQAVGRLRGLSELRGEMTAVSTQRG